MVLILGGGLAGLSTAYHLGEVPHLVLEAASAPGGLCRSREVDGFVFDYTGHLLHLRDPRIERLVTELLPGAFEVIERKARIRCQGATLEFPFQANLHGLPKEVVAACVTDFVESMNVSTPDDPALSFEKWSRTVFGHAISETFMLPYNCKLFGREPGQMTADWVSWAVPRPTLQEVVRGALGIENRGMGYNPTFRYPSRGGIGILPRALAQRVEHLRLNARAVGVDLGRRRVDLEDGTGLDYDRLVVTTPLPEFLRMSHGGPEGLSDLRGELDWSVVGCLNLGVERAGLADGAHWIYFPDPNVPFYRVGFPTNFSDGVAPAGRSSIYVEFGLRRGERCDPEELTGHAVEALTREGTARVKACWPGCCPSWTGWAYIPSAATVPGPIHTWNEPCSTVSSWPIACARS
jgi:protoporphyrinogen oxidase